MTCVVTVVCARPQFIKAAPVSAALAARGIVETLIHTGQHYDDAMSRRFFVELGIPEPAINLGVGSGGQAAQTCSMMAALEPVLKASRPDWVVIYGDTNSTLAGLGCGQARSSDRPYRGRAAVIQSTDARGDQSDCRRQRCNTVVRADRYRRDLRGRYSTRQIKLFLAVTSCTTPP